MGWIEEKARKKAKKILIQQLGFKEIDIKCLPKRKFPYDIITKKPNEYQLIEVQGIKRAHNGNISLPDVWVPRANYVKEIIANNYIPQAHVTALIMPVWLEGCKDDYLFIDAESLFKEWGEKATPYSEDDWEKAKKELSEKIESTLKDFLRD